MSTQPTAPDGVGRGDFPPILDPFAPLDVPAPPVEAQHSDHGDHGDYGGGHQDHADYNNGAGFHDDTLC